MNIILFVIIHVLQLAEDIEERLQAEVKRIMRRLLHVKIIRAEKQRNGRQRMHLLSCQGKVPRLLGRILVVTYLREVKVFQGFGKLDNLLGCT